MKAVGRGERDDRQRHDQRVGEDDRREPADLRADQHPGAAEDRAQPHGRGQHRQALRAAVEDAVGKAGEQLDKAARADRRHREEQQHRRDAGMPAGIGIGFERGAHRVLRGAHRQLSGYRADWRARSGRRYRSRALAANAAAMLTRAIRIPAIAGPINRAALNTIELIASADGSASRSTRVGISASRAGWAMPWLIPNSITSANSMWIVIRPVATRIASSDRLRAADQLGDADDADPVAAIRHHPGERRQKQHRQELGQRHQAEPGAGMGQGPGEPAARHALHPGADQLDRVAADIDAVIAVGRARGQHCRSRRPLGADAQMPMECTSLRRSLAAIVAPRVSGRNAARLHCRLARIGV